MADACITLLTDFGRRDAYVAAMKGVLLSLAGDRRGSLQLVDITHAVSPHDISGASYLLAQAYPYFPAGTVHLVVVDPGVGGLRRAIAVQAKEHYFVGPDNGVFSRVYRESGEYSVREIAPPPKASRAISATFHGRDIFAPAAAGLALGGDFASVGSLCPNPRQLEEEAPLAGPEGLSLRVVHCDVFGNLITNMTRPDWAGTERGFLLSAGDHCIRKLSRTYSDVAPGSLLALINSRDQLEIAVNQGSAAQLTGLSAGSRVVLDLSGPQGKSGKAIV